MKGTKTQYRITGRFRGKTERHVVDWSAKWSLRDAMIRLDQLQKQSEREMNSKKRDTQFCGSIGIGTEYYSEYDLLELRIESREVTPWSEVVDPSIPIN